MIQVGWLLSHFIRFPKIGRDCLQFPKLPQSFVFGNTQAGITVFLIEFKTNENAPACMNTLLCSLFQQF